MMQQTLQVSGIGAAGAGITSWSDLNHALNNPEGYVPAGFEATTSLLSAAEKRRASLLTRLVLSAAQQACPAPPPGLRAVFVSNTGDGATTHAICETLAAAQPSVSPTSFTNSVHNAAAAYWSIALRNKAATTSMSGGENGFSAALIEVWAMLLQSSAPVLLVAYDAPYPFPFCDFAPARVPFALALMLSPVGSGTGWRLALHDEPAESLPATLPRYFDGHVCTPGLVWLAAQTRNERRRIVLPYLDHLAVILEPVESFDA